MTKAKTHKKLKKELSLLHVYTIATGTTLSAGFFLLPGIAAQLAGPALILAYAIAAIPIIPAMFSIVELSTAMPRAGGVYYYLDRSLGPMIGTIGGIGTWLSLILKVAFALIGMGTYIGIFFPGLPITTIAVILALILGGLNVTGAKQGGGVQLFLVFGLLAILALFIITGSTDLTFSHFDNFFGAETANILSAAGLVYISYGGITKVASLSEEVKNPEKNLSLGVFLSIGTALLVYILGTIVIVGVLPMDQLIGNLTPVADAAKVFLGYPGTIILTIAALLAFLAEANAGSMSASRYPLAMSRDHLMPARFRRLGKFGTPIAAIVLTTAIIVLLLLILDPMKIAKLASAFQLLIFAFLCLAVIVMRESQLDSYDPGFKSPFYPWMQIFGILASIYLIVQMGFLPIIFSSALITLSFIWYWYYGRKHVIRNGAIYHIFERLGQQRFEGLDSELRGILKEKGLRKEDPFDEIVAQSKVFDLKSSSDFESVVSMVSVYLQTIIPLSAEEIVKQIMDGTRIGATPVTHGVALPHFRVDKLEHPEMVLVRSKKGISIETYNPLTHQAEETQTVYALFFLVSPESDPTQHLRILAQIAGRVDEESFSTEWINALDEQELKEALLRDENFRSLFVCYNTKTETLIGKSMREIVIPDGCLVALIRRGDTIIVPKGSTTLENGDRITVIGDAISLKELERLYVDI